MFGGFFVAGHEDELGADAAEMHVTQKCSTLYRRLVCRLGRKKKKKFKENLELLYNCWRYIYQFNKIRNQRIYLSKYYKVSKHSKKPY